MKKLFSLLIVSSCIVACNNSSSTSTTSDDSSGSNPTNIENVNGNVPDTTSGMNLNHSLPLDSSRLKDSARRDSSRH